MRDIHGREFTGGDVLLAVSFGTSFADSRKRAIGSVEEALEEAFPEYHVCRAFTSRMVIGAVKHREGVEIDSVEEAIQRAAGETVRRLLIQPTHMMEGNEYHKVCRAAGQHAEDFEELSVGKPLLADAEDFRDAAGAVTEALSEYADGETAICLMGHGTEAASNRVYVEMQELLRAEGFADYYVATVEAEPTLADLVKAVKQGSYTRIVLMPLMLVAGDHACNDMAGEEEDSWKRTFEREGFRTECVLRGLGELPAIREIFVRHAKAAAGITGTRTDKISAREML